MFTSYFERLIGLRVILFYIHLLFKLYDHVSVFC